MERLEKSFLHKKYTPAEKTEAPFDSPGVFVCSGAEKDRLKLASVQRGLGGIGDL